MVRDSDGSALITKAEFDSLRNSFQSQIDSYNMGIDNKIDSAVAAYLSGVKLTNESILSFINESWEACYEIDGEAIENQYNWPEKALYFSMMTDNLGSSWYSASGVVAATIDTRTPLTQARIMCDAGVDPKSDSWPKYVTWEGWAKDFKEKITWVRLGGRHANTASGTDYWTGGGVDNWSYCITNGTNWTQGYIAANGKRYAPTGNKYLTSGGSSGSAGNLTVDTATDFRLQSNEITYEEKDMDYKHVIVYDKIASVSVTDKDWTLHVNNMNGDDNDASVLWYKDTWTAKGYADVSEAKDGSAGNMVRHKAITTFYPGASKGAASSTHTRPHVGLSRKKYGYDEIKQQENQIVTVNSKNVDVRGAVRDVLNTGLAAFPLAKDTEFTWDFKVASTILDPLKTPTGGTYAGKYKVYLTIGGFDSDITPISGSLIKNGTDDYWETDDKGECKIKFVVPDDGVLYVKWFPFEAPSSTKGWVSKINFGDNIAKVILS